MMSFYNEHYEIKGVVVVDRLIMGFNVYTKHGVELRIVKGLVHSRFKKTDSFYPMAISINDLLSNSFYVNKEEK